MFFITILFSGSMICSIVIADNWTNELEVLRGEVEALQDENIIFQESLEILEMQLHSEVDLNELETNSSVLKSGFRRAKSGLVVTKTAFSTRLSQQVGNLGDYQVVLFDDVITNEGNNYDSRTGAFRCPEEGTYVFYVSIVSVPNCYVTMQIAKNGQGVAWTFSMDPVNASSGRSMVVLQLDIGDLVNVRINGDRHDYKNPQIAQLYCSFSGFRLY